MESIELVRFMDEWQETLKASAVAAGRWLASLSAWAAYMNAAFLRATDDVFGRRWRDDYCEVE